MITPNITCYKRLGVAGFLEKRYNFVYSLKVKRVNFLKEYDVIVNVGGLIGCFAALALG